MQRFKNILVVLNPEIEQAATLERAVSLIKKNGGRLTLLSLLKEPTYSQFHSGSAVQQQLESAISERREWLQDLTIPLQDDNIDFAINVVQGAAFLEIIRQVLREDHDLVIITAEEKTWLRTRLFGTTSMHLMRKCPCPVWVIKKNQSQPYSRVLAAIDPSHDPKRNALNSLILQLGQSMALKESAELHIVHVWKLFGETYISNSGMSASDVQEVKVLEKEQHKQNVDSLLERIDSSALQVQIHLLEGDPDERIPELVKEQSIDLLVMGSVCRTGIAGFLIGNTAEEVLNHVDCSVLTLKPEGFVTPVMLEDN